MSPIAPASAHAAHIASGPSCVVMTYPTYAWITFLAVAGIIVLAMFTAAEITIMAKRYLMTRRDRSWYRRGWDRQDREVEEV
jgi:hypothetical protein